MEIACLDLGSNSFHLQHIDVSEGGIDTRLDHKRSVQLGAGVARTGGIDGRAWREGHTAVAELLRLSRAQGAERLVAVATSAVRSASNGREFLDELARSFDLDVALLSPAREAELSYLGATTDRQVGGRRVAVLDLGGGSTELAMGEGARCLHADSMPIGTLRLGAAFGGSRLDYESAAVLLRALRRRCASQLAQVAALEPERVVFASGVARAVRSLALAGTEHAGSTGALRSADLRASLERSFALDVDGLMQLGVDPARAPTIQLATLFMLVLCEGLGVETVHVTKQGLRSGMALCAYREARTRMRDASAGLQRAAGFR